MKQDVQKKSLLKWIYVGIIAAGLSLAGCSSLFTRNPAAAGKPRHFIMTLHGVRGNAQSFGEFHQIIKKHLEAVDPTYEVVPLNYTYEVARIDYTVHSAAAEINQKLDAYFKANTPLRPEDKLSVVAYSMGGQVGMAWYYDSLNDATGAHTQYAKQTDKFISLGGAFWGAQEAALFTSDVQTLKKTIKAVIKTLADVAERNSVDEVSQIFGSRIAAELTSAADSARQAIRENVIYPAIDKLQTIEELQQYYDNNIRPKIAKISFAELQGLSIVGPTETELRLAHLKGLTTRTKWISISTLVPCFKADKSTDLGCRDLQNTFYSDTNEFFKEYLFGIERRETDNAVITPSSISQFIYALDSNPNYVAGALTPLSDFKLAVEPTKQKTYFAETLHATVITEGIYNQALKALGRLGRSWAKLADDVVIVHEKCLDPKMCDHPAYKYIADELSSCNEPNSSCNQEQYQQIIGTLKKYGSANEQTVEDSLKSQLHGFTLELNLRLPSGYSMNEFTQDNILKYISFNSKTNRDLDKNQELIIAREKEMASVQMRKQHYSNAEHLKINFTGYVNAKDYATHYQKYFDAGRTFEVSIKLPGLKTRRVQAIVRPTLSTYVDLQMAK